MCLPHLLIQEGSTTESDREHVILQLLQLEHGTDVGPLPELGLVHCDVLTSGMLKYKIYPFINRNLQFVVRDSIAIPFSTLELRCHLCWLTKPYSRPVYFRVFCDVRVLAAHLPRLSAMGFGCIWVNSCYLDCFNVGIKTRLFTDRIRRL